MTLVPLQEHLAGRAAQALTILQIAGLFVMLIACANIANLILARTASRQREVSIRMAIGAGKGRVLRQFFCEGLLLAAAGGVAGVFLAKAMLWAMIQWGSKALPRLAEAELDSRVLAFTFVLSVASAMLFCFGPAAALWRMDIQMALKDRGADSAGKPGGMRMRRGLVVLELAIAVILAVGAGLMIRSFSVMYSKIAGFEPARTLVMQLAITGGQYKEKSRLVSTIQEIIAEIESLPGVQSAAIAERQVYLLQSADSAVPNVVDQFEESLVSPGYFSAIGMKLVAGRWIEAGDPADAAVINETLAKKVFGSQDPIGQFIQNFGRPVRVVGVAANLKYSKMDADPGPELYRGYAENLAGFPSLSIVARVKGDPLAIAEAARARVTAVAPQQAIHGIRTLGDALSDSIAPRRFNLVLLIGFAGAALLMATIGIYGVVSYSVSQRTKEIGLRMALGATRRQIATLIIGGGMSFILAGIVTGLGGAYALTRWMASLLYGVEPHDFSTFAVVPVLLGVTALLACAVPAARAARVDPLVSLRQE
jgi:putative ABC transport system permease protein